MKHAHAIIAAAIGAAAAALTGGCAAPPTDESSHADVHCTKERATLITLGQSVYVVPGGCIEWSVGPTQRQREEFDRDSKVRGGSL